mmetsp:Transcript_63826/g.138980  ORF Transcript_63826/g.138980 Transcript_63826/m.138980 type:complete len:205 (-) Transcript_63826:110-724(-)
MGAPCCAAPLQRLGAALPEPEFKPGQASGPPGEGPQGRRRWHCCSTLRRARRSSALPCALRHGRNEARPRPGGEGAVALALALAGALPRLHCHRRALHHKEMAPRSLEVWTLTSPSALAVLAVEGVTVRARVTSPQTPCKTARRHGHLRWSTACCSHAGEKCVSRGRRPRPRIHLDCLLRGIAATPHQQRRRVGAARSLVSRAG